jgi:hypothetical protein
MPVAVGMPQTGTACPRASGLTRTFQLHSVAAACSPNAAMRSTATSDANDRFALRPGMSHTLRLRQRIVNPRTAEAACRWAGGVRADAWLRAAERR